MTRRELSNNAAVPSANLGAARTATAEVRDDIAALLGWAIRSCSSPDYHPTILLAAGPIPPQFLKQDVLRRVEVR